MAERLSEWKGVNFVTDPTWGDNGKGKLVDLMAGRADMVVRTNGGPNAGHTVKNSSGEFALHVMPSGIFNPNALCIVSDTVVVNPISFATEIMNLRNAGVCVTGDNLLISRNAHLIMPWHQKRDGLREKARGGEKIGTTGQGIGPVYSDRTERVGLRVGDLVLPNFEEKFDKELKWQEALTRLMSGCSDNNYDRAQILEKLYEAKEIISPMVTEVLPVIWDYFEEGRNILGEPGQGVLLDLDRGGYPYVTSSHPGIAGLNLATGIPPKDVNRVIAVTKAYATRVGEGPLPSEIFGGVGEEIRKKGKEYGATTGRPRRVGWLDIPAIRYGARVGGADSIAITKLDILDGFTTIGVCVAYEAGGKYYNIMPTANNEFLSNVHPVLVALPGWEKETTACRRFRDLPQKAQKFIEKIQELIRLPIELVSVGPDRNASIYL